MLRNSMALICGATLALASTAAAAQGWRDWYGALHVGKGWKDSVRLDDFTMASIVRDTPAQPSPWDVIDTTHQADMDYDSGWSIGAAVGRAFGDWRLEGELGYRASEIDSLKVRDVMVAARPSTVPLPPELREMFAAATLAFFNNGDNIRITGRARLFTGALNVYYDLPVEWAVRPYVGTGIGVVRAIKQKRVTFMGDAGQCLTGPLPVPCVMRASDRSTEWNANWHVMAGVKRVLKDRWEAALGWRYTHLKGLNFEWSDGVYLDGEPRFLGGDPLKAKKNSMSNVAFTLMRRF